MPMEGRCLGPENSFGVSRVNNVAGKSNTIEVNGDHFFKRKKTTENNIQCLHPAPVVSSKACVVCVRVTQRERGSVLRITADI